MKSKVLCGVLVAVFIVWNGCHYDGGFYFPASIYGGMGGALISIPFWTIVGGHLILNIGLALYYLVKPESKITICTIDRVNFGLIVGLFFRVFFGVFV